jgi:HD-like signal output (HDOD) protein
MECLRRLILGAMKRLEALQQLAAEAQRGELVFPTSVAAASRIHKALDDPDIHLAAAAVQVQTEPLLAARCVAMANSAAYRRSGPVVTDVGSAVSRLGLRIVRTLAQALIVRQLAGASKDPGQRSVVAHLWEHTAHVASLSRLIAKCVAHQDPETALFAGLVHEAGNFYLLSRVPDFPVLLNTDREPEEEDYEIALNRAVVETLSLPAPIIEALEIVWTGYVASPTVSLGDTVALAKALAPVQSPFASAQVSTKLVPFDMIIGEDTLSQILQDSKEEINSLTRALTY